MYNLNKKNMYTLNYKYTTGNQKSRKKIVFLITKTYINKINKSSTQQKIQANKTTTLLLKENWTDNLFIFNINVIIFIQFYATESDITVVVSD